MTNLDAIINKIMADAEEKAKKIIKEAEDEGEKLIERSETDAKEKVDRRIQRAKLESEQYIDRTVSSARIKARDAQLKAKGEVIDRVLKEAEKELISLTDEQYIQFLKSYLHNISLKGNEKLLVPENRQKAVEALSLDIPIEVSKVIESGFQLVDDRMIHNYSCSSIIKFYEDGFRKVVANYLFNEKE